MQTFTGKHSFGKRAKWLVATLIVVMLGCALWVAGAVALPHVSASAADLFADWQTGGWTVAEEDGVPILRGNVQASMNVLNSVDKITANCLSFDVQLRDSTGETDGCVGAAYRCKSGYQYFFEYNTIEKSARVRRIGDNGTDMRVGKTENVTLELQKWYAFRFVFERNNLVWYIDGQPVATVTSTGSDSFMMGSCYIQGYYCTPWLKNITLTNADGSTVIPRGVYDWEFATPDALRGFTATDGSAAYDSDGGKGTLRYAFSGDGYLQTPYLNAAAGNAYSARPEVKNTLFVRMKNDSAAEKIRVDFTTSEDTDFSQAVGREFSIEPNSDYTSYFFNLAGLTKSKGYYTQFRFTPIGGQSGAITIDCMTFEREKAPYDYAGEIVSCTADENTVTIVGKLSEQYAGKSVSLYELSPENYTESVEGLEASARVMAQGTDFTLRLPLKEGKTTRLSALFTATVGGVKISDRFSVENYRDFTQNPYAFTLPDRTVRVTDAPYLAAGDAYTNDTPAIQKAIDDMSAAGGGKVVVPGDDSFYGRRYVVTNVKMKDNVELCIERGAVLWQSPREADYAYEIARGHDVVIPGVNWAHAASCHNLPLVQGDNVRNVRVTGGGTLRGNDQGGDNTDTISGISIWTGCNDRIHVVPVGFWRCENVEVSDLTLMRNNNYHINMRTCNNVYIANMTIKEGTCASGDGISATVGTKHMLVDRCFSYCNDDAVTLCSTYNDPRGLAWWRPNPDGDNNVEDIVIKSSNLFGGHGITFITWGTDAPDLSKQEIKDIEVYDCILNGLAGSVGTYADNPYYGEGLYDGTATDDFSPVKQVRLHDNEYRGLCTLDCIAATDFISDCGLRSARDFQNGNFERANGKVGWVSGLSNWSYSGNAEAVANDGGHAGKIAGGKLYQGLWQTAGSHTFTADTRLLSGSAKLFVADAESGEVLAEKAVPSGSTEGLSVTFELSVGKTLYLGIETDGEAVIDNAAVSAEQPAYPRYFTENFETMVRPTFDFDAWVLSREEENAYVAMMTGGGAQYTPFADTYESFDLRLHVKITDVVSRIDANVGFSFCRADSDHQYYVEYNPVRGYFLARRFDGEDCINLTSARIELEADTWYLLGLRVQNGSFELYLDGARIMQATDEDPLPAAALVLCSYNAAFAMDNVTLAEAGTLDMTEVPPVALEEREYVLRFDGAGGENAPAPQVLRAGDKAEEVAEPTRAGYVFDGWAYNGKKVELATFRMPDDNVRLTALWAAASGGGLPWWGILLIVIGCAAVAGGACAAILVVLRRRKRA